ncbi:MAG: GNAT family N-acetyltransferase [Clostridia bacterium]|nr:GNAT family N-acetyltransferase [Clostridia bacterium]
MISFKVVQNTEDDISALFEHKLTPAELEAVSEIIDTLDTSFEDVEYAVSFCEGCLLLRIFDTGRYLFAFPFDITEDADLAAAISLVSEYAMREEVPTVFVDVPAEALSLFAKYRHMNIDAEDAACESFRIRIKTECELIDEIPTVEHGRVKLNAIKEADIAPFAALCKNDSVNKYWGYDYKEDVKTPSDEYFYENAKLEFARGVSISLAIRVDGAFAGEATIYAFNGRGGAEFAIRLLPEFAGRGLGTESVRALMLLARKIGLTVLRSKIMKENAASIAMISKITDVKTDCGDAFTFEVNL